MSFSKLDTLEDIQEMIPDNIQNWESGIAEPDLLDLYKIKRHSTKVILDKNDIFIKKYSYGEGSPSQWKSDLEALN
ncbi:MAG: hypothetical protein ACJ0BE_00035 [Dehalococcoidia bacterium]|jgi:hypothetical protein